MDQQDTRIISGMSSGFAHRYPILETGTDSFRFKARAAAAATTKKKAKPVLDPQLAQNP